MTIVYNITVFGINRQLKSKLQCEKTIKEEIKNKLITEFKKELKEDIGKV
jgi:hypothetical protein